MSLVQNPGQVTVKTAQAQKIRPAPLGVLGFLLTKDSRLSYQLRPKIRKEITMVDKTTEVLTLKALCTELNVEPRIAHEKLRIAAREPKKYPNPVKGHKPRQPWEWTKGSSAESEARTALAS
jgi:hypothetical protein